MKKNSLREEVKYLEERITYWKEKTEIFSIITMILTILIFFIFLFANVTITDYKTYNQFASEKLCQLEGNYSYHDTAGTNTEGYYIICQKNQSSTDKIIFIGGAQ